jgi:GTPase SAR1 family protein
MRVPVECVALTIDFINASLLDVKTLLSIEQSCEGVYQHINKTHAWRHWYQQLFPNEYQVLRSLFEENQTFNANENWKKHFMKQLNLNKNNTTYKMERAPTKIERPIINFDTFRCCTKILFVGPLGVGRHSIHQSFINRVFSGEYEPTIGDDRVSRYIDGYEILFDVDITRRDTDLFEFQMSRIKEDDIIIIMLSIDHFIESIKQGYEVILYISKLKKKQPHELNIIITMNKMDIVKSIIDYEYWIELMISEYNVKSEFDLMTNHFIFIELSAKKMIHVEELFITAARCFFNDKKPSTTVKDRDKSKCIVS